MKDEVKLTHTSALVLKVISGGCNYGFDIMEESGLIVARWEPEAAQQLQRPQRRYYKLTRAGERTLVKAALRYPLLQNLTASEEKR
jgi:PadR family transcriptional regulator PadR